MQSVTVYYRLWDGYWGAECPQVPEFVGGDASLAEVVGRQFDLDLVSGEDADVVLAHLSADMGYHHMTVLEAYLERRVGQGVYHLAIHLENVFLRHPASLMQFGAGRILPYRPYK